MTIRLVRRMRRSSVAWRTISGGWISPWLRYVIISSFFHLHTNVIQLVGESKLSLDSFTDWELPSLAPPIPAEFRSLQEARLCMERQAHCYFGVLAAHRECAEIIDGFKVRVASLIKALNALVERQGQAFTAHERRTLALLRMHQKEMELALVWRRKSPRNLRRWDQHTEFFDEMLDQVRICYWAIDDT